MWMWLCVIAGTILLGTLAWFGMQYYGVWAKQRDELERQKLQEEWKRRAAERKAKAEGAGRPPGAAGPVPGPVDVTPEETGDNPPLY